MRTAEGKLKQFGFGSGIHQEANQYASTAGTLNAATNLRIPQRGVLGKRRSPTGYDTSSADTAHPLTGDGTSTYIEEPSFVTRAGDATILGTTVGDVWAWNGSEQSTSLVDFAGRYASAIPLRRGLGFVASQAASAAGFGINAPAVAVNSTGHIVLAATEVSGDVHIAVEDANGRRLAYIIDDSQTFSQVKLVAVGATVYVVANHSTTISARALTISSGVVNLATGVTVGTLTGISAYWDVTPYDGTNWFMVHQSGATTLRVDKFAGTTSSANTTITVTGTTPVSIYGDSAGANVWIGYYDDPTSAGGVKIVWASPDFIKVSSAVTLVSGANVYGAPLMGKRRTRTNKSGDALGIFYAFRYRLTTGNETRAVYTGTAVTDQSISAPTATTPAPCWHVLPITKPDDHQRVWCMVMNGTDNFLISRVALLRFEDPEQASPPTIDLALPSMESPGESYGPDERTSWFNTVAVDSTNGRTIAMLPFVVNAFAGNGIPVPIIAVHGYQYQTSEQHYHRDTLASHPTTLIAGSPVEVLTNPLGAWKDNGALQSAGPGGATEIGFLHAPTITDIDITVSGSVAAGTYSYRAIYYAIDGLGRVHRSAPSAPVSTTLTVLTNPVVSVTYISATQRNAAGLVASGVELFRTQAGGATYFASEAPYTITNGIAQFSDSTLDSTIGQNEELYTDGGVLSNDLGPSCRFMARAEDAIWFGGLWRPELVQRSKLLISPDEPVQCTDHESHQVVLPGACTGLAYLDGQTAAFMQTGIALFGGAGPNDQGSGEFSTPRLHTTGIGCIDYRSVVQTDIGVFFLSSRGFELLPRGFGPVEYIGEPLRADFEDGSIIGVAFADVHRQGSEYTVRFGVLTAASDYVSTVYTFDLIARQWFKDTYAVELASMGSLVDGMGFLTASLTPDTGKSVVLWVEDSDTYADPTIAGSTSFVGTTATTNWIFPFEHGGYGKITGLLLEYEHMGTDVVVTLTYTPDRDNASAQAFAWTSTGSQGRQYKQFYPTAADCASFKISIVESTGGTADAQGIRPISITAQVEPSAGLRVTSQSERAA